MKRITQCLFAALLIAVGAPVCAYGDLIAYDGYDYTTGASLIGQNGGTGWANSYSEYTSTSTANCLIENTVISSADSSGNSVNMNSLAATDAIGAYRTLDITGYLSGTIYLSFISQAYDNKDRTWGLSFANYDSDTGTYSLPVGAIFGSADATATSCAYSIGGANGGHVASSTLDTNARLFVAKVDMSSGDITLYLLELDGDYPVSETGLTADAFREGNDDFGNVNAIRWIASYTSSYLYADVNVDELRIGTSWEDVVVSVPEPSSIALLACGLIGLLAYAWRKRK